MPNKEKDKDVVKGWVGLRGGSGQVLACLVRRACLERFFLAVCSALLRLRFATQGCRFCWAWRLWSAGAVDAFTSAKVFRRGFLLCVGYVGKIYLNKSAFLLGIC